MAASAIFCRVLLLVLNAAALALPHRRLLPPLPLRRRGLLRDAAAILMVLGASVIFHDVTGPNDATEANRALAAAGFVTWVAGVGLLLLALTPGRFLGAPARVAVQLVRAAGWVLF
jgi:hypothetical protein